MLSSLAEKEPFFVQNHDMYRIPVISINGQNAHFLVEHVHTTLNLVFMYSTQEK